MPNLKTPATAISWNVARETYDAARQEHEAFLDEVLRPAWQAVDDQGRSARLTELEKQGDDLCEVRQNALRQLVLVPIADAASLRLKFRLAYDEVLRFSDEEGFLRAILADLDRLAG